MHKSSLLTKTKTMQKTMLKASIDSKTYTQGGRVDTVEHAPDAETLRSTPGLVPSQKAGTP